MIQIVMKKGNLFIIVFLRYYMYTNAFSIRN